MCAPDAPEPPDPRETSAAQTGTSVGTAIANTYLGNVNQRGPNGSLTYNRSGTFKWTDPYTGQTYNIPQFTAVTQLTPMGQKINSQNNQTQLNLATMGREQSARVRNILNTPFNLNGLPEAGTVPGAMTPQTVGQGPNLGTVGQGPNLNGAPVRAGQVTRSYGAPGSYAGQVQRVENALMQRLQPQLERDRQAQEASLANQGITLGSRAYSSAQDDLSRAANDARTGVLLAAGQEQSRLAGLDLDRAQFQNAAQAQAFGQGMTNRGLANSTRQQEYLNRVGATGFNNSAAQQEFQNEMAGAGFNNAAQSTLFGQNMQRFGAQNILRNQGLQERFAMRNQPINEITALLSGSQISMPNFGINQPATIPTTDVAGNINANFNQQLANYQNELGQWNSTMGGIFGLAAAPFKFGMV